MISKSILFICNDADYFAAHRLHLASRMIEEGYATTLICGGDRDTKKLRNLPGLNFIHVPLERHRLAPIGDFLFARAIAKAIQTLRPTVVHSVTVKPNLLTMLAAGRALDKIHPQTPKIVLTFPGLGRVFAEYGLLDKIRQYLVADRLRHGFGKFHAIATFENQDDLEYFVGQGIVDRPQTVLIEGAGIDTSTYMIDRKRGKSGVEKPVRFLFASRFLKAKGIDLYFDLAKRICAKFPNAVFSIAGWSESHGQTSYTADEIVEFTNDAPVTFLGKIDNEEMPEVLANTDVVVLPSFSEGMPRILLEAAASGCAIVCSDLPGCRPIVDHAKNGYLAEAGKLDEFEGACSLLASDRQKIRTFGRYARNKIRKSKFDTKNIQDGFIEIYHG